MIRPATSYDGTGLNTFVGSERRLTFWLVGGLDDGLDVRGEDTVIPSAAGRVARNRVRDRRIIEVDGLVTGTGASEAARMDDFRDAMESLRTLFSPTRAAANLVISLEDGVRTATISCRPLPDRDVRYYPTSAARWALEFEAIGNDWLVA